MTRNICASACSRAQPRHAPLQQLDDLVFRGVVMMSCTPVRRKGFETFFSSCSTLARRCSSTAGPCSPVRRCRAAGRAGRCGTQVRTSLNTRTLGQRVGDEERGAGAAQHDGQPGRLKYMPGLVADSATTMIRVSRPTAAPMTVDGFMDLARREGAARTQRWMLGHSIQGGPPSIGGKRGEKGGKRRLGAAARQGDVSKSGRM